MLQIIVPATEKYDDTKNEFIATKEQLLQLEHSLVAISKWESKWCKPFLTNEAKTTDETIDYIRCMTINQNVNPNVYANITNANIKEVSTYIDAPMTATWFAESGKGRISRDVITSEVIYYWMIVSTIPFECQKWHLNRLLTLIRVCDKKNQPNKKMSKAEVFGKNQALNEARRKQYNSKG